MKRDYIDFQDRDRPLAYFISFRCYGTWLHGNERGSVDRKDLNKFGGPKIPPTLNLIKAEERNLKSEPFILDRGNRLIVRAAIREVCDVRGYRLWALNVRSTHAHSVVSANRKPEPIMTAFKAYATRKLRLLSSVGDDQTIWSRHGSTKYLWTDSQVSGAIDYVLYCQDWGVPEFA